MRLAAPERLLHKQALVKAIVFVVFEARALMGELGEVDSPCKRVCSNCTMDD